jgi:hypothetical protein
MLCSSAGNTISSINFLCELRNVVDKTASIGVGEFYTFTSTTMVLLVAHVGADVEALIYETEGRGNDSRFCHCILTLT